MTKAMLILLLFSIQLCFSQTQTEIIEEFDNTDGWTQQSKDIYTTKIEDGHYIINHTTESGGHFFWKKYTEINYYGDFTIKTKLKITGGSKTMGIGIIFGTLDSKNYQSFFINGSSKYKFTVKDDNESRDVVDWTLNEKAIKKFGEYNEIWIEKVQNRLKIWVNDDKLIDTNHIRFSGQYLGWLVYEDSKVEIDYLKFYQTKPEINLVEDVNTEVEKINLGNGVNTMAVDYVPLISADGKTLYFSRKRYKGNIGNTEKQDAYVSKMKEDGSWGLAYNIGAPINNSGHNSIISVSTDENVLLINNTYKEDGSPDGSGISRSVRTENGWTLPKKVEIINYENQNRYVNYTFSADEKYMIVACETNTSYGDQDLYISFKQDDGTYSEPVNMGSTINTFGTEMSPFLAPDNKTLYYSSNGHPGYGSQDVFISRRLDETWLNWTKPQNLGEGINSSKWEAYYKVPADGEYAYMTISVPDMDLDLFKVKQPESAKPEAVVLIRGTVYNAATNEPISAEIEYSNLELDSLLGTSVSDPKTGKYKIILTAGNNYGFNAIKENFFPVSENMDLAELGEYTEIEKDLYLYPVEVGSVIRLNNVFFEYNKSGLKNQSKTDLNRLIKLLNGAPSLKIEISGHTDSRGSDSYNLKLSDDRAKSVKEFLVQNGIDSSRLEAKGYGESNPIDKSETEEGMAKNRRVEFKIINK